MIIEIDSHRFDARFEYDRSPTTCDAFRGVMPFVSDVVHVRWSGEGMWIPLGDMDFNVGYENATSYPAPGQILLSPRARAKLKF